MARTRSALGFFGLFGRSSDLRQLDAALRAVDLHPALVPEGAKLAIVNLLKDGAGGRFPPTEAYAPAAEIIAYCLTGEDGFTGANGTERRAAVERRIERAIEDGDSLDARLVLLTLHAKLIRPEVVERFDLGTEDRSETR